ncbi:MAG: 16S rRNA methyltransferase [Rhodobacterales bacterium]|nr:MAG: 16S rRNA methyltransferase [Rhodobacterales bacterium]
MTASLPPRRSALYLMDRITFTGALMAELLAEGALERLQPEDRARAQRLATQTLRELGRADTMLKRHMTKMPAGSVMNILRLGAVELCLGGAAHGVVHDWVELCARGKRTAKMKGLVNAVLRKVAADAARWETLPPSRMPGWLRDPLVMAWGEPVMRAMEVAHAKGAPLDLSLKGTRPDGLDGEDLPTGSLRLTTPGQVSALPGFADGAFWVQDAAAAIPARVLAPAKGEKVLDLCAAPGGKTLQLAAMGAEVTAIDASETRLERLSENLSRCGLKAQVKAADVLELTDHAPAILLDAPCSATGTIRRHPDLPYAKDGSEFAALIELQSQMIDHALGLLDPGGRLVYCTCSLLPDEGEVQIEEALARHPGLKVDRDALDLPGIDPDWITSEGGLRLRPDHWADRGGMDGFYIACLRKD